MELREELAELCHKQWSGWMEYLFSKCENERDEYGEPWEDRHGEPTEGVVIPKWAVERWKRQMTTPYKELSEEERESDMKQADKFIVKLISLLIKETGGTSDANLPRL